MIGETSQLDLTGNENDQASSVRVRKSCTLTLFEHHNNVGLLDSLSADFSSLSYNDQVSSVSCTCQGIREKNLRKVGGDTFKNNSLQTR